MATQVMELHIAPKAFEKIYHAYMRPEGGFYDEATGPPPVGSKALCGYPAPEGLGRAPIPATRSRRPSRGCVVCMEMGL
jgi:hypothetical protein